MLPPEAVNEFKSAYKKTYGIELNDAEAQKKANNLFALYKAVFRKSTQRILLRPM